MSSLTQEQTGTCWVASVTQQQMHGVPTPGTLASLLSSKPYIKESSGAPSSQKQLSGEINATYNLKQASRRTM